jgi:hypothetical protein
MAELQRVIAEKETLLEEKRDDLTSMQARLDKILIEKKSLEVKIADRAGAIEVDEIELVGLYQEFRDSQTEPTKPKATEVKAAQPSQVVSTAYPAVDVSAPAANATKQENLAETALLQQGDNVRVIQAFEGNSSGAGQKEIKAQSEGVVVKVDNDGDAFVDFGKFKQWIKKRNFSKLKFGKSNVDATSLDEFPSLGVSGGQVKHRLPEQASTASETSPLGRTSTVMSTIEEDETKDGAQKINMSTKAEKYMDQDRCSAPSQSTSGRALSQSRKFLEKKIEDEEIKTSIKNMSFTDRKRVVEIYWYLGTGGRDSNISRLSGNEFCQELKAAMENYAEKRKSSNSQLWGRSWAVGLIDYRPEPDFGQKKGWALVLLQSQEQAEALILDYEERPAGWPIVSMCGQNAWVQMPRPEWLSSRLRAVSSAGSSQSKSMSNASHASMDYNADEIKKKRNADIEARRKLKEARDAKLEAAMLRKKEKDSERRKLISIMGIPEDLWGSSSQTQHIKETIVTFVDTLCAHPPGEPLPLPRSAFRIQASFKVPRQAKRGCCYLAFDYSDETADMASWLVSSMQGQPQLPWGTLCAELAASSRW